MPGMTWFYPVPDHGIFQDRDGVAGRGETGASVLTSSRSRDGVTPQVRVILGSPRPTPSHPVRDAVHVHPVPLPGGYVVPPGDGVDDEDGRGERTQDQKGGDDHG